MYMYKQYRHTDRLEWFVLIEVVCLVFLQTCILELIVRDHESNINSSSTRVSVYTALLVITVLQRCTRTNCNSYISIV